MIIEVHTDNRYVELINNEGEKTKCRVDGPEKVLALLEEILNRIHCTNVTLVEVDYDNRTIIGEW